MKQRLKNLITSIIGGVIMVLGVIMGVMNIFDLREEKFTLLSIVLTLVLGWIFLMGKDDMIKGIFNKLLNKVG